MKSCGLWQSRVWFLIKLTFWLVEMDFLWLTLVASFSKWRFAMVGLLCSLIFQDRRRIQPEKLMGVWRTKDMWIFGQLLSRSARNKWSFYNFLPSFAKLRRISKYFKCNWFCIFTESRTSDFGGICKFNSRFFFIEYVFLGFLSAADCKKLALLEIRSRKYFSMKRQILVKLCQECL